MGTGKNGDVRTSIDEKVTRSIKGSFTLIVPLIGILAAWYSTKSDLEKDILDLRHRNAIAETRIENVERESDWRLDRAEKAIDSLRSLTDSHMRSGPDGLRHPQGLIRITTELRERIEALEKKP